jgi:DNA-binding NarL/FixJ family response regulator
MIYVGILEDNIALRDTIATYLVATGKYHILFSEGAYNTIKNKHFEQAADIILLDIHLLDVSGIEILAELKSSLPTSEIILMTGDTAQKQLLLKGIENGASSFIYKPMHLAALTEVMGQVLEKGNYLQPEMVSRLMGLINTRKAESIQPPSLSLSDREEEILGLVEKGLTYKEIASKLFISYHTVNFHLKNIYAKCDVKSKMELVTRKNKK